MPQPPAKKVVPLRQLVFFLTIFLSACGSPSKPTSVQSLLVESGDYGIPTFGKVESVDIIRRSFEVSRYDRSFSELTRAALSDDDGLALNRWVDFASELSRAAASEFEEYVRGQLCIYQVSGINENISTAIYDEVLLKFGESDSLVEAESRAYERLDLALQSGEISASEIDSTLARFVAEEVSGKTSLSSNGQNISVFSQCLIGVSPGSQVGLIKLTSKIAIIPDRETALFSMHRNSSDPN